MIAAIRWQLLAGAPTFLAMLPIAASGLGTRADGHNDAAAARLRRPQPRPLLTLPPTSAAFLMPRIISSRFSISTFSYFPSTQPRLMTRATFPLALIPAHCAFSGRLKGQRVARHYYRAHAILPPASPRTSRGWSITAGLPRLPTRPAGAPTSSVDCRYRADVCFIKAPARCFRRLGRPFREGRSPAA